jgi:hypothetical protein
MEYFRAVRAASRHSMRVNAWIKIRNKRPSGIGAAGNRNPAHATYLDDRPKLGRLPPDAGRRASVDASRPVAGIRYPDAGCWADGGLSRCRHDEFVSMLSAAVISFSCCHFPPVIMGFTTCTLPIMLGALTRRSG